MSAPQRFHGSFCFGDDEALANAKELVRRAAVAEEKVFPAAFKFEGDTVEIALDVCGSAAFWDPMRALIAEMACQALTGSVSCIYGSGKEREEVRFGALGGGARPLRPLPPPPTNDVERVAEALGHHRLDQLAKTMPKESVATALWSLWREGRCDLWNLAKSATFPTESAPFSIDDLIAMLREHSKIEALGGDEAPLWRVWPSKIDAMVHARKPDLARVAAMWTELDEPVKSYVAWSLVRHGALMATRLPLSLLPRLAEQYGVAESYDAWERAYPQSAWNRAVVDAILAARRCHLQEDVDAHGMDATVDERVRMLCLVVPNQLHDAVTAVEVLGDVRAVLEREAEALLLSLDDPALSVAEQSKSLATSPAHAFHARCTMATLCLLRAGARIGTVLTERFDPLLLRAFCAIGLLASDWTKDAAYHLWFESVRLLPEERRARIYLGGTEVAWYHWQRDPLALVARAAVRAMARLPCDPAAPEPPSLSPRLLASLGPLVVAPIAEALATKGAKRRDVLTAALAEIETVESTAILEKLVKDRAKGVSTRAREALAARLRAP